ncbi:hypothetical protein A2761_00505 [Candidatus Kaiserbacteria bacterium RIFCSPHIGHO2_01_FULL_51_33]|uniref:Uncharacterized protein n=1 Tax=Candidatus Kaiserbacteria bacterium RIFCSPLOWO2_01_FULL_51_21 TaxID=1798508 RepID=A0A1F6EDJ1_9BACT|nr:MAG: hypothetical protein A2761_00505 [Candidatus Kaiserbacteria bacterium RIFCSPHIGHO2_01_FULL_51_33]OGG71739.1 MAG: hypothetical protein A3A35_01930 [Candidatus Kaiserbacteria bacterium RIFCSPLOWO2_01_FULL_51_21]
MTREEIAGLIYWEKIIWLIGLINPLFMLPQLWQIWKTRIVVGLSLPTLGILILIQGGFAAHGFFIRDPIIMWSNSGATAMSVAVVFSIIYLRYLSE